MPRNLNEIVRSWIRLLEKKSISLNLHGWTVGQRITFPWRAWPHPDQLGYLFHFQQTYSPQTHPFRCSFAPSPITVILFCADVKPSHSSLPQFLCSFANDIHPLWRHLGHNRGVQKTVEKSGTVIFSQSPDWRRCSTLLSYSDVAKSETPGPPHPKYKVMYPKGASVRSVNLPESAASLAVSRESLSLVSCENTSEKGA